eukprot:TRINITY_DN5022_c0_g1_i2.p1 TRINITY_DN5022_c0_g1~~TRINITY_DN5022_c0_g1_i2.p1  ORF type:complete len:177 (-),score=32.95 TRINITY_DN5022_c0_g1_i2:61-591(-)
MVVWVLLGACAFSYLCYCIWIVFQKHSVDDSWSLEPIQWVWDDGNMHPALRRVLDLSVEALAEKIPKGFLWGSATAAHQFEGHCTNNNWSHWELKTRFDPVVNKHVPTIRNDQKAGASCDHWNKVNEDVQLMKEFGFNAYRFSVEWSKIEPKRGVFDQEAIQHYHEEGKCHCSASV